MKIEKKCPGFRGENVLIVSIHGSNFSFETQFLEYVGEKTPKFFRAGPYFFVCCKWNVYGNALIPSNLPCPEKFLVVHLQTDTNLKYSYGFHCFLKSDWFPTYDKPYRYRIRSSRSEVVFCENCVLINFAKFAGKCLWQSVFYKKEALAHVFSCEFCEHLFLRTPIL